VDRVIYGEIDEVHGLVGATKKFYYVIVVVSVNGLHLFPFTSDVVGVVPPRDVGNVVVHHWLIGDRRSRNF
jgi:hypothetical protein